jgi:restriction system protein
VAGQSQEPPGPKIQKLKPVQFEQLVAGLFQSSGYKTTTTKGSYDGGVDVIAVKDGRRHLIQCKKFKTQKVSVGMVREFYGALADQLSSAKGYFVTTGDRRPGDQEADPA